MEPNLYRIQSMALTFRNNSCQLQVKTDTGNYTLQFNPGNWQAGETTLHGPYLVSAAKNKLTGLPQFKIAGSYHWSDANTLNLVLRYIESPHTQHLECRLDGDQLSVRIKPSFAFNSTTATVVLKGKAQ
jgi:hypothetical protein